MVPVQSILNQMKVSKWEQVFGKAGSPNIQVPLPITISDGQFSSHPSLICLQHFSQR